MSQDYQELSKSSTSGELPHVKASKKAKYLSLYKKSKDVADATHLVPEDAKDLERREIEHLRRLLAKKIGSLMIGQERTHESEVEEAIKSGEVDTLTGVLNRKGFTRELVEEIANFRRANHDGKSRSSTLLIIDANGLKQINDEDPTHHAKGDEYLRRIALVLSESVRPQDVVARIGGDEFGVLLREMEILDIQEIWENRLIDALSGAGVSVSVGAAPFDPNDVQQSLANADSSMYEAKQFAHIYGQNVLKVYGENIR